MIWVYVVFAVALIGPVAVVAFALCRVAGKCSRLEEERNK